MRICPTCGDMVAATLRCCPRCSGPLPEPRTGYGGPPGYAGDPGYPAEPGYLPAPHAVEDGYLPAPHAVEDGYLPAPHAVEDGYLAEPSYPAEPGYAEEPGYGPAWYEPAPYEEATGPEAFGDMFARAGPKTSGFPPWHVPEPEAVPEEDTASRLLYAPPGRPHQAPRHRARIAGAAAGTVALLAGVITAWAVFGQDRAGPGPRLAGRQTTATHPASPVARATPSPSPPVPAPGDGAIVVAMAPGMSQAPDAAQVDGFLVSYFTAINTHDYERYERLLVPSRRAELTAADFARGYGTTTDTGASIVGISPTTGGVAATVTFTSEQRTAPGADVTTCTLWDITLYLRKLNGTLLIGSPPPAYHAYHRSCP